MDSNISRRQFLQFSISGTAGLMFLQSGCSSSNDSTPDINTPDITTSITQPKGLLVSLREHSIGVKIDSLRLSWLVPKIDDCTTQYACQIQIAPSLAKLNTENELVWDSGQVLSNDSIAISYGGKLPLETDQIYFWRVRVWSEEKTKSSWSEPQKIVTAVQSEQWASSPIWHPSSNGYSTDNWMLARKSFYLNSGNLSSAWIRITAQSPEKARQYVFRLWVNGTFVGLGPVRPIKSESRYHTFDVGSLLSESENVIAVLCYSDANQSLLTELVLNYSDGHREIIGTDQSWKTLSGAKWRPPNGSITNSYYEAPKEYIDARKEPTGWTNIGFDDSYWHNALIQPPLLEIEPSWVDDMAVTYIKPTTIELIKPGHWVLDFGKEVVGGISLNIDGNEGATIDIRLGEELNSDKTVRYKLRAGPNYREVWTLRDGTQILEHWGYRAFRWVEIITSSELNVADGIQACIIKMHWDKTQASFDSSDNNLNKVWELCRYSIEATRQDLYQDTPTRERGAYEGDAIINQLSEYSTQRSYALARYSSSFLVRRPTWPTEYRLQTALLAWQDYLNTGDDSNLAQDYQLIVDRQLVDKINPAGLLEKAPGRSSRPNGDLVDWPVSNRDNFVFTDVNSVINAWQYAAFMALSKIAKVLNYEADHIHFLTLAHTLKEAFNELLLTTNYTYRDGLYTEHESQHATAFPLALGVTNEDDVTLVGQSLRKDIENRGMKVSVYGSQFVLDALYKAREGKAAHDLLVSRSKYSWLHMIENLNATIVMEAWDPSIKPNTTFSHAWGSAPANVIQRHIAGVKIAEPGASKIIIEPQPGNLQWFKARVPTIRGSVEVVFNRTENYILELKLPPNVSGELILDLRQLIEFSSDSPLSVNVLDNQNKQLEQIIEDFLVTVKDIKPGVTIVKIDS